MQSISSKPSSLKLAHATRSCNEGLQVRLGLGHASAGNQNIFLFVAIVAQIKMLGTTRTKPKCLLGQLFIALLCPSHKEFSLAQAFELRTTLRVCAGRNLGVLHYVSPIVFSRPQTQAGELSRGRTLLLLINSGTLPPLL